MIKNFNIIIVAFLFFIQTFIAQNNDTTIKHLGSKHIEIMVIPAMYYNSLSIGYSKMTSQRHEKLVTLATAYMPLYSGPAITSIIRGQHNIYIKQGKKISDYIPFWLSVRYLYTPGNSEGDFIPATNYFIYAMGTGYGLTLHFKNKHQLRAQIGAGIALPTYKTVLSTKNFQLDKNQPLYLSCHAKLTYVLPLQK